MTVKAFGPVLVVDDLGVPVGATVGAFTDPDTGVAIPALGLDGVTPVTVATSPRGVTGQWMLDVPAAGYVFATFGTMRLALAPLGADPVAGLPVGGTTGQALVKASGADGDVVWQTVAGGSGSVASVNGQTGAVVLTAADVGAATSAQGAKADTASQPGHTHVAGDITSGTLAVARLGTGTADSGKVLYGDGTWKAAPSGGAGRNWIPGTWGLPGASLRSDVSNESCAANTMYFSPFHIATAGTLTDLAISVGTAATAGSLARVGVYAQNATGSGWTLVSDVGTVAIDTTGEKVVSALSVPLASPGMYAAVVLPQAACSLVCRASSYPLFGSQFDAFSGSVYVWLGGSQAYGALPATFSPSGQGGYTTAYNRSVVKLA